MEIHSFDHKEQLNFIVDTQVHRLLQNKEKSMLFTSFFSNYGIAICKYYLTLLLFESSESTEKLF